MSAKSFLAKIFRRDPDHRITTKDMLKDSFLSFADIEYEAFINTNSKTSTQRNHHVKTS